MSDITFIFQQLKQDVFRSIGKMLDHAVVVQVGAHRGTNKDDVYLGIKAYGWRGYLIEAVAANYEALQKDYASLPGTMFFHAAICDCGEDTVRPIYYLKEDPRLGELATQIGSLSRQHVERYLREHTDVPESEYNAYIVSEEVNVRRLDQFLTRNDVDPDIIYIDTEGADFEVLKTIDFSEFQPSVIYYEHAYLSDEDKVRAKKLLEQQRYFILSGRFDTIAIHHRFWMQKGNEILNSINTQWLQTESELMKLSPFKDVFQMVAAGGTFRAWKDEQGDVHFNRIDEDVTQ